LDYKKYRKILFVSSFTPPLNAGSGRNAYNFASFLAERGYHITLLSLNRKGKFTRKEIVNKIKIIRLLYFNYNLFSKVLSVFIILPGYVKFVAQSEVVFIYGGNIIGFELIILIGKILKKKIIFQSLLMQEDDIGTLVKRRLGGRIRKNILNQISIYFSLNPEFSKIWTNIFGSNEKVFESVQGVNTGIFYKVDEKQKGRLREKLGLSNDRLIIITIGYLIERKGFSGIFKLLTDLNFPFYYLVVGDYSVPKEHYMYNFNQEMKELHKLGKEILGEKVIFTGPKTNISEYLNASDIFLFNSSYKP